MWSDSNSITVHLDEEGVVVYPCRCGETHTGDYAAENYCFHNCLHECNLEGCVLGDREVQAICPDCGMAWQVKLYF